MKSARRENSQSRPSTERQRVMVVNEEVPSHYESYLHQIQQRNLRLRQLQCKNKDQIEREKKEEGFSLYFQGANKHQAVLPSHKTRHVTAVPRGEERGDGGGKVPATGTTQVYLRSKTAPDKGADKRKGWGANEAVSIRTEVGGFISARPPDLYSEDFENEDGSPLQREADQGPSSSPCKVVLNGSDIHKLRQSLSQSLSQSYIPEEIMTNQVTPEERDSLPEIPEQLGLEDSVVLEFDSSTSRRGVNNGSSKLDYIMGKIQSLSQYQHKKLLNLLEDLDTRSVPQMEVVKSNPVTLHILSNWGHHNRVGLTEVDFILEDGSKSHVLKVTVVRNGTPLPVSEQDAAAALVNGKAKTSNERAMWSCEFCKGDSLQVTFDLKEDVTRVKRVEIWNFNKSLNNLVMGVRCFRITVGPASKLLCEGEMEKNGGNQAFAHCHVVDLKKAASPKKVVVQSPGRDACEQEFEDEDDEDFTSAAAMFKVQRAMVEFKEHPSSQSKAKSPNNISTPSSRSDSGKSSQDNGTSPAKRPVRNDDICGEMESLSLLDQVRELNNVSKRATDPGTSSGTGTSNAPTWYEELRNTPRKSAVTANPMDGEESLFGRDSPMQKIQKERAKRSVALPKASEVKAVTGTAGKELEQSWSSLSFFNRSHAGRISMDLHGDALDSCLKRLKNKEQEVAAASPRDSPKKKAPDCPPIYEENDSGWSDEEFFIPELPSGCRMTINILTTWGDKYYVGLTGIEVFDDVGRPVKVSEISAEPPDINILPGYGSDPRVVTNLVDGVNRTKDDVHMWLTPFTPGQSHCVFLTFPQPLRVAMIRLWNYNKSRVHYTRGARYIEIRLDEQFIFKGEISRSIDVEEAGETILFTNDDEILERISQNDSLFVECNTMEEELMDSVIRNLEERPLTGDRNSSTGTEGAATMRGSEVDSFSRPLTCAKATKAMAGPLSNGLVTCRVLQFNFIETWGDEHYIGLTGLQLLDAQSNPLRLVPGETGCGIEANPRDVTVLPGFENDCRVVENLLDGCTVTTDDEHMWLAPYTPGGDHIVRISLGDTPKSISGFRIWNYNKSQEDSYRGAKYVLIHADDQPICNSNCPADGIYLLRRAMGNCHCDFGQTVLFTQPKSSSHSQQKTKGGPTSRLPQGFIYQLNLYSAWGDPYYIGLNGVEFYDETGQKVNLQPSQVAAWPDSVNVLLQAASNAAWDVRTPDKLIDGENDTDDAQHMWLAPILPGQVNRVYFLFDSPVAISMVKLWNYSKTPARGVKDFALLVDDLLIHSSCLPMHRTDTVGVGGILPSCTAPQRHHSILFDRGNSKLFSRERPFLLQDEIGDVETSTKGDAHRQPEGQDVRLTNDREIVAQFTKPPSTQLAVDQSLRPKTSVQSNRRTVGVGRR